MYTDFISKDGSYNINLANKLGLQCSVYLSELINQCQESSNAVDRDLITQRTTLDGEAQKDCDSLLRSLSLISGTKNIKINYPQLLSFMGCNDEDFLKDVKTVAKSKARIVKSKNDYLIDELKNQITTTNQELRTAYELWIEDVYSKEGWMSKGAVISAQMVVDAFSNHNLDKALALIRIASTHAYRDMNWAVDMYNKNYKSISKTVPVTQSVSYNNNVQLSDEVF